MFSNLETGQGLEATIGSIETEGLGVTRGAGRAPSGAQERTRCAPR